MNVPLSPYTRAPLRFALDCLNDAPRKMSAEKNACRLALYCYIYIHLLTLPTLIFFLNNRILIVLDLQTYQQL